MSFARYPAYKDSGVEWLGEVPGHWEVKRLKYNLQLLTEKTNRRDHAIALENIESWTGRYLPTETEFEGDGVAFEAGDILFGKLRPYLAKAYLTESSGEAVGDFHVLRPTRNTHSRFAQYQILNREFIDLVDGSTFGSKMPRASWEFVAGIALASPPKAEQQAIATFLDTETAKIDGLMAEQRALVALLKEKRQAVISHAVTKGLNPAAPMKDSGVAWLGEVPEHWDVKSIKWISPVQRGASPRPIDDPKYFDDDGEYAWVRISDVSASDGELRETTQRLSDLGSSLSVKVEPGDLFISIAGTVGKPCITSIKACIHDGFVYFPKLKLNPQFFFRIFEAEICYGGLGKFGTQLNLNTDTIGSIKVAVPPPEELTKLLTFIDKETTQLDTLTQEAQTAIALLQERRTALISAAVTGKMDVRKAVAA
jgi:type I restriction enzyme S subunit